jgi:hypothetical protein
MPLFFLMTPLSRGRRVPEWSEGQGLGMMFMGIKPRRRYITKFQIEFREIKKGFIWK